MVQRDTIEFWLKNQLLARIKSSMVLQVGNYISINKKTYIVDKVTFAVDDSEDWTLIKMRQNVDLVEY